MEEAQYYSVLKKFSLDMFLTKCCNLFLFQYKLKIYM